MNRRLGVARAVIFKGLHRISVLREAPGLGLPRELAVA